MFVLACYDICRNFFREDAFKVYESTEEGSKMGERGSIASMNFKKILMTTILVASQVAALALPASAEENVPVSNSANETTITETTSEQQPQIDSGEEASSTDPVTDPDTEGAGTVEGEAGEPATEQATEPTTEGTSNEGTVISGATSSSGDELILLMNSKKMYHNGVEYLANYPMEVKDGVSYVSIRAIVEQAGFQISYDSKTKETIIVRGSDELRFKLNTTSYKVNGVTSTMRGKSYSVQNNFMVPLTAITQALEIPYTWDQKGKRVIMNLSTKPVASFTIGNKEVISGETIVQYLPQSSSPTGQQIVSEEWQGRQETFMTPGNYVVTYRVQDASGQWSDPFSLTITVVKPHTPPIANFTTDKDTYKMGELITYIDDSSDEVGIQDRNWVNNQRAFFSPGPVSIKLTVVNVFGLTSTIEKTITITNETLYTRDEFNQLYTPVGEKYGFDGKAVPSWDKVNYSYTSNATTLIRSNSPETVYSEGVLYRETALGATRFMIHHANATGKNVKMYVIATNNNDVSARLTQSNLGFAGPNQYATGVGKASVERYYDSMLTGNQYKDIWIAPGESKIILNELSASNMKNGDVISLLADLHSDSTLQYDVIMIGADKDPMVSLPYLSLLPRDVHNRGTFMDATRTIEYSEEIGLTPVRLLLGDNSSDPFLAGQDTMSAAEPVLNAGNFGVVYNITLKRVAPNTLVTFNPRGGFYTGWILVNGVQVPLSATTGLNAPNETAVLFRTGNYEQSLNLVFTAAPGSNLSVNLLFQQMPAKK